jgi:hypothetical protein
MFSSGWCCAQGPFMYSKIGGPRGHLFSAAIGGGLKITDVQQSWWTQGLLMFSSVGGPRVHLCSAVIGGVLRGHLCTAKLVGPGAP